MSLTLHHLSLPSQHPLTGYGRRVSRNWRIRLVFLVSFLYSIHVSCVFCQQRRILLAEIQAAQVRKRFWVAVNRFAMRIRTSLINAHKTPASNSHLLCAFNPLEPIQQPQKILGRKWTVEPGVNVNLQGALQAFDLRFEIEVVRFELGLTVIQGVVFLLFSVAHDVLVPETNFSSAVLFIVLRLCGSKCTTCSVYNYSSVLVLMDDRSETIIPAGASSLIAKRLTLYTRRQCRPFWCLSGPQSSSSWKPCRKACAVSRKECRTFQRCNFRWIRIDVRLDFLSTSLWFCKTQIKLV